LNIKVHSLFMPDNRHALVPCADSDRRAAEKYCKGMALLELLFLAVSMHHGHAGIERTDTVDTALLEGQGNANVEWQNDVEGLTAVYEAMVSTPGTSTMLYKTAGPQVGDAYLHHPLISPVIVLQGLIYTYTAVTNTCSTNF